MKVFFLILIFSIFLFSAGYAEETDFLFRQNAEYGPTQDRARRINLIKRTEQAPKSSQTLESLGHQGQTLLLIFILSGVEIVRQNMNLAKMKGSEINPSELRTQISEAAEHIVTSGEILGSLTGAATANILFSKPLTILKTIIQNSASKTIFKNFLASGIHSFITFIGWELGAELFVESVNMIDDEKEYERAQHFLPVIFHTTYNQQDRELFEKIMSNMFQILYYDHNLRNAWLYNTWRNHIATGDFAVIIASMVSASAIGTTLFPGAGTIAGMMFGLSGGFLSLFVPQETKDDLTGLMQSARLRFWMIGSDQGPFFSFKESVLNLINECVSQNQICPPLLEFNPQKFTFEKEVSITVDKIFSLYSRMEILNDQRLFSRKNGQIQMEKEQSDKLIKLIYAYKKELDVIASFYAMESKEMKNLLVRYPELSKKHDKKRYPQLAQIENYMTKIETLEKFFTKFKKIGNKYMLRPGDANEAFKEALYRFHLFGFSEDKTLKSI